MAEGILCLVQGADYFLSYKHNCARNYKKIHLIKLKSHLIKKKHLLSTPCQAP